MPKRLIDDSLLGPGSLSTCSPRAQDAWHRLILVADDFGCTEVHPVWLKGKAWSLRPDVSAEDVASWLGEWARAGMLFVWEQSGRVYGYLIGWHKPHGQKWRAEYKPVGDGEEPRGKEVRDRGSKRRTPPPPGWTGQRPLPWTQPPGWIPGEIWRGVADTPLPALPADQANLGFPVPGRELDQKLAVPALAVAVAVPDAIPPAAGTAAQRGGRGREGAGSAELVTNGAAAPEGPAGPSTKSTPAEPAGPGAAVPSPAGQGRDGGPAGPSMLESLRGAIAQALGIIGSGGVGIEICSSRRLGELIRNANEAVALRGFGLVVEACAAVGREMIARGDPPETMAAFGRPLRVLAAPDAEPQPLRHNGTYRPEPRRPELT